MTHKLMKPIAWTLVVIAGILFSINRYKQAFRVAHRFIQTTSQGSGIELDLEISIITLLLVIITILMIAIIIYTIHLWRNAINYIRYGAP